MPVKANAYSGPIYDGAAYSIVFDRLLAGLHQRIAACVEEGSSCFDACCGPGGLTFRLAEKCSEVVGVDISEKMIARARSLQHKRKIENVTFHVADVSRLEIFPDNRFDVATVAMGLHEMPTEVRSIVLPQLLRLAAKVIIVDFVVPMPANWAGLRNKVIERLAGRQHYLGFKDYCERGGLPSLIEQSGACIEQQRYFDSGTLLLAEIIKSDSNPSVLA
jgi:SAM-dependent methyltransferase